MSLLDVVIGGLMGSGGGASSPIGSILSGLLRGSGTSLGGSGESGMGDGFGGSGMNVGGIGGGGLGGLLSQFENAGLGNIAQSWVGNGPNQPVSPAQLQDVFGRDQVKSMANHAGMQPGDLLSQLSQHLPNAVNGMTPNGRVNQDFL